MNNINALMYYLNDLKIPVDYPTKDGATCLMIATQMGNLPIIHFLLQHGKANINARNHVSLLHYSQLNTLPSDDHLLPVGGVCNAYRRQKQK